MNNNVEETSLSEIISIMYKRKRVFMFTLIGTIIFVLIMSYIPPFRQDKQFEAVSGIAVTYEYKAPENEEGISEGYVYYQDRLSSNSIVTIKSYLQSRTVLRSVIKELDLKNSKGKLINVKALKKLIRIEEQPGSNLISITVENKDEKKATDIANLIPKKIIEMTNANSNLMNYNILIIDEAIAYEKTESNIGLIILIGMGLGLIIAILSVYIKELSSNRILRKSEIYRKGLEVEAEFNSIDTAFWQYIINGALLSNSKNLTVGLDINFELKNVQFFINLLANSNYEIEINNYIDSKLNIIDKNNLLLNNLEYLHEKNTNEIIFLDNKKDISSNKKLTINLIDYQSPIFPQVTYLSDKTIIIIEEEKTLKKDVDKIVYMEDKYKLDLSTVYLTLS